MLKQLQEEHRIWSLFNFGVQPSYHSLLGAAEEIGELAHAHLKGEQGIRSAEATREAKEDAIADAIIYLAGYCNSEGINLEEILQRTWDKVKTRDWRAHSQDAHEYEKDPIVTECGACGQVHPLFDSCPEKV